MIWYPISMINESKNDGNIPHIARTCVACVIYGVVHPSRGDLVHMGRFCFLMVLLSLKKLIFSTQIYKVYVSVQNFGCKDFLFQATEK